VRSYRCLPRFIQLALQKNFHSVFEYALNNNKIDFLLKLTDDALVDEGSPLFVPLRWHDFAQSPVERARALLAKMNFDENMQMVHGWAGQ